MLRAYRSLLEDHETLRLIIVPRHPDRFDEVEGKILEAGFECIRRSSLSASGSLRPPPPRGAVILVDRMGELAGIYSKADIVFLGGSLVNLGGHNILEAALWKKPVLVGPHMWNFREMTAEFLAAGALLQVSSFSEFEERVRELLQNPVSGYDMGARASRILEKNRGASRQCAEVIGEYLLDIHPDAL